MFCPQCGTTQPDELKFCKNCGTNLASVRIAVEKPETVERFDWSKTWVAEMFQSSEESVRREQELERLRGITPEVKRRKEIKAGVITASVGLGVMILLFTIMNGIILSGLVTQAVAEILSRVWIAGAIPLFVGLALVFNGMVVSKRDECPSAGEKELRSGSSDQFLPPATTKELTRPASVTEDTTKHLKVSR